MLKQAHWYSVPALVQLEYLMLHSMSYRTIMLLMVHNGDTALAKNPVYVEKARML